MTDWFREGKRMNDNLKKKTFQRIQFQKISKNLTLLIKPRTGFQSISQK